MGEVFDGSSLLGIGRGLLWDRVCEVFCCHGALLSLKVIIAVQEWVV